MRTIRTLMGCCLVLATALPIASAHAADIHDDSTEGVALVSHCDQGGCSDGCTDLGCCHDSCDGGCYAGCATCGSYGYGAHCGRCGRHGRCGHYGHCGHCGHCHGGMWGRIAWLFCGDHTTYAPGHGFVFPTKRRLWDVSYPYGHMYNATAVGAANGQVASSAYGNVYMPTDTTQLGYSYGHVPYWMPKHGAVPPVPHPEAYHSRICLPVGHQQFGASCPSGYGYGEVIHEGYVGGPTSGVQEVATEPTLAPIPQ